MSSITSAWSWFLGGLTEAAVAGTALVSTRRRVRIVLSRNMLSLHDQAGTDLGRIVTHENAARFEPSAACPNLNGGLVDMIIPDELILHRDLNPIAVESLPFLDAYARHQIDRVTPWKAAGAFFGVTTKRRPETPGKLAVAIHVIARPLLAKVLAALSPCQIARLRLVIQGSSQSEDIFVPIDEKKDHQLQTRRLVQAVVLGSFVLIVCTLTYLSLQILSLQSATNAIGSLIAEQEDILSGHQDGGGGEFNASSLFALRDGKPRAVETLEAMSSALPDDSYLVSFQLNEDKLQISGISKRMSDLVPALEGSHHFLDVSFAEATTRVEDGAADRFHLSMRVAGAKVVSP